MPLEIVLREIRYVVSEPGRKQDPFVIVTTLYHNEGKHDVTIDDIAELIVHKHLIGKVPISDLCDEFGLQPTQVYQWKKQIFENAESVFDKPAGKTIGIGRNDYCPGRSPFGI